MYAAHTNHVSTMLPDYIRGTLDDREREIVEEHLRQCTACRSELVEVEKVFAAIERGGAQDVAQGYFSSLLPRIHQRLDERKHFGWSNNPMVHKFILPVSAAIVAAVLIAHVRLPENAPVTTNPLLAVVDSASTEDIGEIVRNDIPSHEMNSFNTMVISHAMTDDQFVRRELVEEALTSESTSPFDVYSDVSPLQVLSGFDESETNAMLQRLGSMETL